MAFESRVVDQDFYLSKLRHGICDEFLPVRNAAYVALESNSFSPQLLNSRGYFLRSRLV